LRMREKSVLAACIAALALTVAGCGSKTSTQQNPVTGLTKRVLLSNSQTGAVIVMDAKHDVFSNKVLGVPGASKMVTAGGFTAIMESNQNGVAIIDNTQEKVLSSSPTAGPPFDIALSPDGKVVWAATRNPGVVQAFDTASGNLLANILVPSASRLALSPQGTRLLVFVDDPQSLPAPNTNAAFIINTANVSSSTPANPVIGPGFDQPFTAVWNASENQAFILNCGAECGGTAASVISVDFSGSVPAFSAPVPVAGATVGLLSGSNLFVAGTPPVLPTGLTCPASLGTCGTVQTVSASGLTASGPVAITDGLHLKMALTSNNKLYIGASSCTPVTTGTNQVRGCLSIFDTGSQGTAFPSESAFRQGFDVTGLQPISGRNIIYVCQGGELDFFDITTNAVAPNITLLDVVGRAFDVLQIDP
jgi:hypothetical protein